MQYINSNDILYDKQFGFRKGHSTSHAIITLVEKVSKTLATGKIVVGVYLDIRKAFNCVRHSTLLYKLHKIGIRGNLFCLIKSYLMSRTQYMCIIMDVTQVRSPLNTKCPKDLYGGPYFSFFYECFFQGISIPFFYTHPGAALQGFTNCQALNCTLSRTILSNNHYQHIRILSIKHFEKKHFFYFFTPGYTREPPSGASRRSWYTREPHYKG